MMRRCFLILAWCLSAILCHAQWDELCAKGNGFVDNFITYDGKLLATGFFTKFCDIDCSFVVAYDGNEWQPYANGLPDAGHKLANIEDTLYAVAYQQKVDSNWVYKYDGQAFKKMSPGVYLTTAVAGFSQTANLYNIISYQNKLVACGEFDRVGNKKISGIMQRLNGEWQALGTGLSGNINGTAPVMYPHDMCIFENDLIVCGNFKNAGGKLANGIARWNGTDWQALGTGFNSTVYAVYVHNGVLYAGGDFTKAGSKDIKYIAKWNGQEWVDAGFGLYYQNSNDYTFIHTITAVKDRLIVSGGFDRVAVAGKTLKCGSIVSFDGSTIDTLMGGFKGKEVEAVAFYNNKLYAGGGTYGNSYVASYDIASSTIESEDFMQRPTISPNPSNGHLEISHFDGIIEAWLTNDKGQILQKIKGPLHTLQMDIEQQGYYILQVKVADKVTQHKVIVLK